MSCDLFLFYPDSMARFERSANEKNTHAFPRNEHNNVKNLSKVVVKRL